MAESISGPVEVITSEGVQKTTAGETQVSLTRIVTHFHFANPSVLIEQHYSRPSVGTLTSVDQGDGSSLLPGKATFSQYLILTLDGRTLANREALVMTAERVEEWPPIGSSFVSEASTDFFELDQVDNPNAQLVATLMYCNANNVAEFAMPAESGVRMEQG